MIFKRQLTKIVNRKSINALEASRAQQGGTEKLTVPELRTLINQRGKSCKDGSGKFLPKSELIQQLAGDPAGIRLFKLKGSAPGDESLTLSDVNPPMISRADVYDNHIGFVVRDHAENLNRVPYNNLLNMIKNELETLKSGKWEIPEDVIDLYESINEKHIHGFVSRHMTLID